MPHHHHDDHYHQGSIPLSSRPGRLPPGNFGRAVTPGNVGGGGGGDNYDRDTGLLATSLGAFTRETFGRPGPLAPLPCVFVCVIFSFLSYAGRRRGGGRPTCRPGRGPGGGHRWRGATAAAPAWVGGGTVRRPGLNRSRGLSLMIVNVSKKYTLKSSIESDRSSNAPQTEL